MDIDQDNQSQTIVAPVMIPCAPYCAQPNLGTVNLNKRALATLEPAKDLKELHEEYKQYRLLKKKDDMNSNEDAGTAAYVVSLKWVQKYLKFLLYEQFNRGVNEHQLKIKEDHFSKMLPGPITNYVDVIEKDEQRYNLFGTDTIKGQEKEYIDTYIDTNFKQNHDFYIINEELW